MALTPREKISLDNGKITKESVEEILETYNIKGLSLKDLQEKYVNMVDDYNEKINGMDEKYEKLNSSYSNLTESITELTTEIQDLQNSSKINTPTSPHIIFIVVFFIAVIISFYVGKYFPVNKNIET